MSEFENFDVSAWTEQCLTRHVRRPTFSSKRRVGSIRSLLVSSIAASIGAVAVPAAATAAQEIAYLQRPIKAVQTASDYTTVDSPAAFWGKAIRTVQGWKPIAVPASDDDPPELF